MSIPVTHSLSIPDHEVELQFTRSSGPGGQNVNKVSTRVELVFDVAHSPSLTPEQRERLLAKLRTRIDSSGRLHLASQDSRSQFKNREDVVRKFADLLRSALKVSKKRRHTAPTRGSKEARLKVKKTRSATKAMRQKPPVSE
ncbi:MAG: aminoacyl-tRNA hydrolase [Ignavibacteriae bacterium]|nr:aminoacyl-tRNA hydrolase [Ignavibacteriota bacterium]